MKANIQGVTVEGTVDEIAMLIDKLNKNTISAIGGKGNQKIFDIEKVDGKPFKQDDPYSEHRNIIYTNKNNDPFDQITVRFENTRSGEKLMKEISKHLQNRGVGYIN